MGACSYPMNSKKYSAQKYLKIPVRWPAWRGAITWTTDIKQIKLNTTTRQTKYMYELTTPALEIGIIQINTLRNLCMHVFLLKNSLNGIYDDSNWIWSYWFCVTFTFKLSHTKKTNCVKLIDTSVLYVEATRQLKPEKILGWTINNFLELLIVDSSHYISNSMQVLIWSLYKTTKICLPVLKFNECPSILFCSDQVPMIIFPTTELLKEFMIIIVYVGYKYF